MIRIKTLKAEIFLLLTAYVSTTILLIRSINWKNVPPPKFAFSSLVPSQYKEDEYFLLFGITDDDIRI